MCSTNIIKKRHYNFEGQEILSNLARLLINLKEKKNLFSPNILHLTRWKKTLEFKKSISICREEGTQLGISHLQVTQ
jgi:hypothetical protein